MKVEFWRPWNFALDLRYRYVNTRKPREPFKIHPYLRLPGRRMGEGKRRRKKQNTSKAKKGGTRMTVCDLVQMTLSFSEWFTSLFTRFTRAEPSGWL